MKIIKITLLSLSLFYGSGSFAQVEPHWNESKIWITLYKQFATYKCICEATGNELDSILWKRRDYSFAVHSESLGKYGDHADSIGRKFAREIQPLQVDKESDLYGLKASFAECLQFFKSKYLDSIAKEQYKIYAKEERKYLKDLARNEKRQRNRK